MGLFFSHSSFLSFSLSLNGNSSWFVNPSTITLPFYSEILFSSTFHLMYYFLKPVQMCSFLSSITLYLTGPNVCWADREEPRVILAYEHFIGLPQWSFEILKWVTILIFGLRNNVILCLFQSLYYWLQTLKLHWVLWCVSHHIFPSGKWMDLSSYLSAKLLNWIWID